MVDQVQPQTPAPVTNDDKIGLFAKAALGELTQDGDVNQMDADLTEGEQEPQEAAPEGQEDQPEAEEATPDGSEIPMVEVELEDGTKVQVPENIKAHVMRDKDYRQKTMALAEMRKGYEQLAQQAQQVAAQAQQLAPYHAKLQLMEGRAQFLQQSLTHELANNDPIEFNKMQGELAILLRERDSLANGLQYEQGRVNEYQQMLKMQQLSIEAPKLFEEIPDLAKQEERESLGKYVLEQGLNHEEYQYLNFSVPGTRLAWKARQYDRLVAQQAQTKAKLQTQVKTLPPVSKSSRSVDNAANIKQAKQDWKRGGGKIHDANFSALLRQRIGK